MNRGKFIVLSQQMREQLYLSDKSTVFFSPNYEFSYFYAGKGRTAINYKNFQKEATDLCYIDEAVRIKTISQFAEKKIGMALCIAIPIHIPEQKIADIDNYANAFLDFLQHFYNIKTKREIIFNDKDIFDLKVVKTASWDEKFHISCLIGEVLINNHPKLMKAYSRFNL